MFLTSTIVMGQKKNLLSFGDIVTDSANITMVY